MRLASLFAVLSLFVSGCGGAPRSTGPVPKLTPAEIAALEHEGRVGNAAEAEEAAEEFVREARGYSEDVEFSWGDTQPQYDVPMGVWKVHGTVAGNSGTGAPIKEPFTALMFVAVDMAWHCRRLTIGKEVIEGDQRLQSLEAFETERRRTQQTVPGAP